MKKKILYGCEGDGDADSPWLIRWKLETPFGALYVHRFLRSDAHEHHDHPWNFVSIILWRGYFEETVCQVCEGRFKPISALSDALSPDTYNAAFPRFQCMNCEGKGYIRKRYWPGMVLFRPATHRHRVVLVQKIGRLSNHPLDTYNYPADAWTLVIRGPYVREWGFFTKKGWQHWGEYFKERGCK